MVFRLNAKFFTNKRKFERKITTEKHHFLKIQLWYLKYVAEFETGKI